MTKSRIPPNTISFRLESLALNSSHRAMGPSVTSFLMISKPFSSTGKTFSEGG